MKKKSTLEAVMLLDFIMRSSKKGLSVAFLDVKAVYDLVERNILCSKLRLIISPSFFEVIRDLFSENKVRTSLNNMISSSVYLRRGLTQGSILAPLLYNVYMNHLPKEIAKLPGLPSINYEHFHDDIGILQFADNIALVAEDDCGLARALKICEKHEETNQYKFNVEKSVVFQDKENLLKLYNRRLKVEDSFKCLGAIFNKKGIDLKRNFLTLKIAVR